jgi:hypothetical protein
MSTLNKILTKFSAQEPMKVEFINQQEKKADMAKASQPALIGYEMVQKAKNNFKKSIALHQRYIVEYEKWLSKAPKGSPEEVQTKKAIQEMKDNMKTAEQWFSLASKLAPDF